jgi:hypothetical protein
MVEEGFLKPDENLTAPEQATPPAENKEKKNHKPKF